MRYSCQCWYCGEFILLCAPTVHAGHYPCPCCEDGVLFVPETALTPLSTDPVEICAFEHLWAGSPNRSGENN